MNVQRSNSPVHPSAAAAIADLSPRFGPRISVGEAVRRQHANTMTWIGSEPPDAVVFPRDTGEVAAIIAAAARHAVPVVTFGAGTSLEGHVNAPRGGLCIDMSGLNRILEVCERDLDCTVEAGVSRGELNRHLRDTGLFFSVDPGTEAATLGGMAATRASGTNSVRYGTMRDNVVRMTAVMADGSVVRTGSKARKSAAGYDLTRLLIGSEGTLGIITELTLRLFPVPESVHAAVATFSSVERACDAVIEAIQSGLSLARIELLDGVQIRAINAYARLSLAEAPTLFVELHGSPEGTAAEMMQFTSIAEGHGAIGVAHAADEQGRRQLWKARHDAFFAVRAAWPGKDFLVTDVCVPISQLARCVAETEADIRQHGLIAPIVGHVGDGNFHAIVVFDPTDRAEREEVAGFVERLTGRALGLDGTCTGEHGIGQGKRSALALEAGPARDVMRSIKQALDPAGILNPGKML